MSTLNLTSAAKLLMVHPKTLQALARTGCVPACKVGRAWVFVEALLLDHLKGLCMARLVTPAAAGGAECHSTDAKTRRTGGSSSHPSVVSRDLYSRALGLPTNGKLSKSTTG